MPFSRRAILKLAASLPAVAIARPAFAQAFPNRPVRIIVPYAAGGYTDVTTRIIANKLTEVIGRQVIVENRAGANGIIGSDAVAKAPADGYTLLMASISHTVLTSLVAKVPFDPVGDFTAVAMAASTPSMLVTGPASPYRTVAEFVADARAKPDKLAFASPGGGTLGHLLGEAFKRTAGIDIVHVPYRGGNPALNDVMSGQVPIMFDNLATTGSNARAGTIRPLAICSPQRHPLLPEAPTMVEAGYPDFVAKSWSGILAPAGTPPDIIAKLNKDIDTAIASTDVKQALANLGTDGEGGSAARFADYMSAEGRRWNALIKAAGIKAE